MPIENTSERDPIIHLLGAMSDGSDGYIEGMEAAGQRQLVASQDIPVRGASDTELEALGFELSAPHGRDPLFRPAKLPPGWKREGSDHSMWSYIVDQHGRRRIAVLYKAAYYDRDAFLSVTQPSGYLSEVLYDGREPVLDDEWLTVGRAVEELDRIRARCLEVAEEADRFAEGRDDNYWRERAAEHRASADKAAKLRAKLAGVAS